MRRLMKEVMQQLANVVLHQGDCLDFMKSMANDTIDTIITDPPY